MSRIVILEDNAEAFVLRIQDGLTEQRYTEPKTVGDPIWTTRGHLPAAELTRTVELTDRPTDVSVATVFRTTDGEIVRRDVWVITTQGAGALGVAGTLNP
jgi:hypothetical protein